VSIHFAELPDPRRTRSIDHPLQNILFIALCAALGSADNWVTVELFAQEHSEFFERWRHALVEGRGPAPPSRSPRRRPARSTHAAR